jgi:hypothetical protein
MIHFFFVVEKRRLSVVRYVSSPRFVDKFFLFPVESSFFLEAIKKKTLRI